MEKRMNCLALFFFLAFLFTNCDNEDPVNPNVTDSSSEASRKGSGPVANAGSDATIILPTNSVVLDGGLSKTFDGVKNYKWDKVSGPDFFSISDPLGPTTSVTNLVEGSYSFRLTVTDSRNRIAQDDVAVLVSKETATSTTGTSTDAFYFQGNMDNVSISTSNSKLIFNGWDALKTNPFIENFEINNIGGIAYAYQQIKAEPNNAGRNAMYATILDDDPAVSGTTRAQNSLRFKDGVDLPIYHFSHRMYLNPDIGYIQNYSSSVTWFTLVEMWNKHVDSWDGSVSGSARWGLSLNKDSGTGQQLYWRLKSDYMQPETVNDLRMWTYLNKTIPIPLGKWFTLDIYMKRGEGTDGRMIVKITPDGGATEVVFDIANSTIYPGHPEIQLKSWQPFKLYLNDVYLDWMRTNGKTISAYYNDFKWYQN